MKSSKLSCLYPQKAPQLGTPHPCALSLLPAPLTLWLLCSEWDQCLSWKAELCLGRTGVLLKQKATLLSVSVVGCKESRNLQKVKVLPVDGIHVQPLNVKNITFPMKFTSIYGTHICTDISGCPVPCRNPNWCIGKTLILLISKAEISIARAFQSKIKYKRKKLLIKLKCGVTAYHILLLWHLLFSKGKVPLSEALTGREVTCYLHFSALLFFDFSVSGKAEHDNGKYQLREGIVGNCRC